jgi:hypothetical protein
MDLQTRKKTFVKEFLAINNEAVILRLEKKLQQERKKSIISTFMPFSIEEFNKRIDRSMEDSKNGSVTESNELLKEIKAWI